MKDIFRKVLCVIVSSMSALQNGRKLDQISSGVPFPDNIISGREYISRINQLLNAEYWPIYDDYLTINIIQKYCQAGGCAASLVDASKKAHHDMLSKVRFYPNIVFQSRIPTFILTRSFFDAIGSQKLRCNEMLITDLKHFIAGIEARRNLAKKTMIEAFTSRLDQQTLTIFSFYRFDFEYQRSPFRGLLGVNTEDLKWHLTILFDVNRTTPD